MTKKKRQTNENYVKMTTPKHDAETSTFTHVAAEITSNREKSLTSQTPTPLEPRQRNGVMVHDDREKKLRQIVEVATVPLRKIPSNHRWDPINGMESWSPGQERTSERRIQT